MKIKYIMTKNVYFDGEEARVGYGIAAVARERGVQTVVEEFRDMSADREKVKSLIKLCNRGGLSLLHLSDVAEDLVLTT